MMSFMCLTAVITEIRREDIRKGTGIGASFESEESGVYMAMSRGGREFYITAFEYSLLLR